VSRNLGARTSATDATAGWRTDVSRDNKRSCEHCSTSLQRRGRARSWRWHAGIVDTGVVVDAVCITAVSSVIVTVGVVVDAVCTTAVGSVIVTVGVVVDAGCLTRHAVWD